MRNKIEELELYLELHNVDIVCLTEHWLKLSEIDAIKINGYTRATIFCRTKNKNGGVVIFYKNYSEFKIKELTYVLESSIEKDIELVGIEIKFSEYSVKLLSLYRSPHANFKIFMSTLDDVLNKVINNNDVILCGDLNIDYLSNSTEKNELCDLLQTYNVNMIIHEPTRIFYNSTTCIDYICTNFCDTHYNVTCQVIDNGISDHTCQILQYEYIIPSDYNTDHRYTRFYNEANYKHFLYNLGKESWSNLYSAVSSEEGFSNFTNTLIYYHDICFPLIRIKNKIKVKNKWVTRGIQISAQKLKLLHQIKAKSNDPNAIIVYNNYKSTYKKVILAAKKMYNDSMYSKATNKTKAAWSIINNNLNNKRSKNKIHEIKINNNLVTDPYQIAQHLNTYFIDLPAKLNDDLGENNTEIRFNPNSNYPTLFLKPATESEIYNIIMELKNSDSSGLDNLSSNLIKQSVCYLVRPLTFLINLSLSEGTFPSVLKTARVFPLHKKGDNTLSENYRPVALLSTISKILERVIFNRIIEFATQHNIISDSQHGFRKNRSTETAIMSFLNNLYENLDQNKKCIGLFMDLSKAFDLVNHRILIEKLTKYGLRGKVNDWVMSYLTNRTQLVEVNGVKSKKLNIKFGVPQGSVLGPLLFLLYINELPGFFDDFLIMFADDNSYLCCRNTFETAISNVQTSLTKFSDHFKSNRLFLNISKTVFIIFSPRYNIQDKSHLIKIAGKSIEQVCHTKFLGIYIDNALNWDAHIDSVAKKLSSVCYALYRLSKISSMTTVLAYYYANFISRATYGILFWGSSCHFERLFKLQKKAVRNIVGVSKYTSCRNLFKELNILTLPSIYILEILLYVKNNLSKFLPNNYNHDYQTRECNNLSTPLHKLSKYEESPRYTGIKLYNKIPDFIKSIENIKSFKNEAKKYLIGKCFYSVNEYLES